MTICRKTFRGNAETSAMVYLFDFFKNKKIAIVKNNAIAFIGN